MKTSHRLVVALATGLLTLSCNDPAKDSKPATTNSDTTAAATATGDTPKPPAKMRRIDVVDDKVAAGEKIFATCAGCHGTKGEGKAGMGPRLASNSFNAAASDDYLFDTIKNGRPGTTMIPWGGTYTDAQIEEVIAYLRSIAGAEPVELDESPLKGDVETGKKLYADICAACHGANGAGYQETANGTGIGRKGFTSKATDGFIRHMARNGKDGTAMKPMQGAKTAVANLTDEEIDSIIKFLRKSAW